MTCEELTIGGVYLTFSGDYGEPYKFAKVLGIDRQLLYLKLYHDSSQQPIVYDPSLASSILMVPVNVFFSWGPPKFPIFVCIEPLSNMESEACFASPDELDYKKIDL